MASDTEEARLFLDSKAHAQVPVCAPITRRGFLGVASATLFSLASPLPEQAFASDCGRGSACSLTVLPEDGRGIYLRALDAAKDEIRIEICVLEDPQILEHVQAALYRGVSVHVIVDSRKYAATASERDNLERYLTSAGGELHLSNPMFPRSFPKIVLSDSNLLVYGSACLDQTTFQQYRDFATTSDDQQVLSDIQRLFENDWEYSAPVGLEPPLFNPTSRISSSDLIVSPVNGAERLVGLYQHAQHTLDVYTELLGNLTLESELIAAVKRGVTVRLIAPVHVNGGKQEIQDGSSRL